jgi:hypothetical protein
MVNTEILGGIQLALSKGETLQQAMQSFYNAGYKKEEIEEAARMTLPNQTQPVQQAQPTQTGKKITPPKPTKQVSNYASPPTKQKPKVIPKASNYEKKPSKGKGAIIALIIILVLLLLGLAAVIIFRENIVNLFN